MFRIADRKRLSYSRTNCIEAARAMERAEALRDDRAAQYENADGTVTIRVWGTEGTIQASRMRTRDGSQAQAKVTSAIATADTKAQKLARLARDREHASKLPSNARRSALRAIDRQIRDLLNER